VRVKEARLFLQITLNLCNVGLSVTMHNAYAEDRQKRNKADCYLESLKNVLIESKIATVDSCFDLAGSRQHGVAEKSKATGWLTYRLLNANGNDRKMKLKSKCLRDPGQYAKSRISCQLSQKGDCGQTKTVPQKINGQTVLKLSCISDRKRPFGQNENAAGVPVINMPAMFSFVVPSSHYCIKTKVFLPLLLWGFLYGLHGVIFTKT